jgi:5-(carboxyamino)imidazole ribonucleotide mutase
MIASFAFTTPVIGVPIVSEHGRLGGFDPLMSIVQMPKGVPVACVAINGAFNAGILAAQMLPEYRNQVASFRKNQTLDVLEDMC